LDVQPGTQAMIIVMQEGAARDKIDHVIERMEGYGLKAHLIVGTNRTVIAAIGDKREVNIEVMERLPGVEKVMRVLAPYKLASLEGHREKSTVDVKGFPVGGNRICIVAGPCAVEDREMMLETAKRLKRAGATALRGGAFKPRTNPYSFQGLEEKGLEFLAEARDQTGLAVVTEVVAANHVDLVAKYADVLQIGARNMQNYMLLRAVGETRKPILLKRGLSAKIDELLLAAEYILSHGNPNVILCERGIRTFESHTRFTLPISSIPVLREHTHLPVFIDPSHGTGKSSLVPAMSLAAIAAGADGLLLEVHPDPENAKLDGAQSLNIETFEELMPRLRKVAQAVGRDA